jgi:hypothetical protein
MVSLVLVNLLEAGMVHDARVYLSFQAIVIKNQMDLGFCLVIQVASSIKHIDQACP